MSRRGVAAAVGKSESTIRGWVERGLAFPDVEPWGSFAVDYQRAERGLEGAAAGAISLTVRRLYDLCDQAAKGDILAITLLAKDSGLRELLNVLAARFPRDWGTSKHREPDADYSGENYLNEHSMSREQLGAVFLDPPESIRLALVDQAHAVYRILLAGGFDPAVPEMRKAEDDEQSTEDTARAGGEPESDGPG